MEYIYRIHCIDNNKDYVGLTNNPKRREARHWNDLSNGIHDNPHLQKAYNLYGREAFFYEILQAYDCTEVEIKQHEQEWIEKLDSYHNGFNCNPGGDLSYLPGKLTKEDVFNILAVVEHKGHQGGKLAKIYDVSIKVISNVKTHRSYDRYIDEYEKLPQSEKDRRYILMNNKYHFTKQLNKSRRRLTAEDVYLLLIRRDYELPFTLKSIANNLGIDESCTPFKIYKGQIYNDFYLTYNLLTLTDKQTILCNYIEKYNLEPFELLENPSQDNQQPSSQDERRLND